MLDIEKKVDYNISAKHHEYNPEYGIEYNTDLE